MVIRSPFLEIQTIFGDGTSVRQNDARQVNHLLELPIYVEVLQVAAIIILGELRHERPVSFSHWMESGALTKRCVNFEHLQ
jgi:metallophosphoesterase superfamily enzyme